MRRSSVAAASIAIISAVSVHGQANATFRDVDVFQGVEAGGNTTPGAQVPFGFVVMQPDTENPNTSGYRTGERIVGFSHTHVSGTGGASKYGNFRVMPTIGPLMAPASQQLSNEVAWPGYYAVTLGSREDAIRVELTATRLVGLHRYTFPRTARANLLIDVGSVIKVAGGEIQRPLACEAKVSGARTLIGGCSYRGGWNPGAYRLFFAAEFGGKPTAIGVGASPESAAKGSVRTEGEGDTAWALASFDTRRNRVVGMKLAVSFVSTARAEAHLRGATKLDFDTALRNAEKQWDEALGKMAVEGGTPEQRAVLVASLYRVHTMPHDLTGDNAWWQSSEPHYEDFYTLWDTFRTLNPLLTVIAPERERDMVRSLIDTYRHTGWLPDARVAGTNGLTQGGSNGDVLVADAIVKGLKGIDYDAAYEALVKDAESDSPDPLRFGREKMSLYKRLGYVPLEVARSGSRTVEYAYDDFAVSQVAAALGHHAAAEEYRRRSLFWANLWDGQSQSIHPRWGSGNWQTPFDRTVVTTSWDSPFYEGSPWQYSTYVPHDVQGLINRLGGDEDFVAWLDRFFAEHQYDPGNEPDLLAPWLYIHAGRPDRTQAIVRELLGRYFKPGREGLPGNDDAGTMSSWYVWSAIGLYPNAGQAYYYIASPVFTRVRIDVGGGRSFVIEASRASDVNRFIRAATLNGRPLDRPWLTHAELVSGGRLVLDLGAQPSPWGAAQRPYSVEGPSRPSH